MPKYEIMIIVDPNKDINETKSFIENIFGNDIQKFEKLDRTELAYPINKSNTAQYVLMEVTTDPSNVKEFIRKVNIEKTIWRELVINLDTEKAMDTTQFIRSEEEVVKLREELAAKRKAYYEEKKAKWGNKDE